MTLNHLRYFLAVVEFASFRKAAEAVNVSQPALSQAVRKLEEQFGAPLFERGATGVRPTAFGTVLAGFFQKSVDSIDRAGAELESMRQGASGQLTIGAPTGMIELFLPEIIEPMFREQGGVHFTIRHGYLDAMLTELCAGRIDFLVTPYWPERQLPAETTVERLMDLGISLYARSSHPLAAKPEATLDDLARARWILPDSGGMRSFLRDIFGDDYASVVDWPIKHDYSPFMLRMLARLDLLTIIPDYTAQHLVATGTLTRIDYPPFRRSIAAGLIYRRDAVRTPAMEWFLRLARSLGTDRFA